VLSTLVRPHAPDLASSPEEVGLLPSVAVVVSSSLVASQRTIYQFSSSCNKDIVLEIENNQHFGKTLAVHLNYCKK
jgi:hypothetical protein